MDLKKIIEIGAVHIKTRQLEKRVEALESENKNLKARVKNVEKMLKDLLELQTMNIFNSGN